MVSPLLVSQVSVLCRDLGLTQLPLTLPPDTIYLDLTNNKVGREGQGSEQEGRRRQ